MVVICWLCTCACYLSVCCALFDGPLVVVWLLCDCWLLVARLVFACGVCRCLLTRVVGRGCVWLLDVV